MPTTDQPPRLPQSWSESTPAERAAWIAEHVMGWAVCRRPHCGGCDDWVLEPGGLLHHNGVGVPQAFRPCTNPADDYRVLQEARRLWPEWPDYVPFATWMARLRQRDDAWSGCIEDYVVGRWTEATYRALTGDDRH